MEDSTELVVAKPRRKNKMLEHNFAPCVKVVMPDKTFVMVPVDKLSSDSKRQVLVARARDFVEKHLGRLMDSTLTPAEVKDLVKAVADVDALQREQYVASLNNATSEMGKGMGSIIREAAKGAAEGTAQGFIDKFKKMDAAAKKVDAVNPPITV